MFTLLSCSCYIFPMTKNTWKVLPLHNVVGPCLTEEFWPPVSSHVSVFPFPCLQQPLVFVLKVSTFFNAPDTKQTAVWVDPDQGHRSFGADQRKFHM